MISAEEVPAFLLELRQFTGSMEYYKSSFGRLKVTEGAHYLRERLDCYWLIDIVESYQPDLKDKPFQIWRIQVNLDRSAVVEMREDSDLEPAVRQEIPWTDFPLWQYEFYCIDGVVLLKSEY